MGSWLDSVNDEKAIEKFPVVFKRYCFDSKYRQSVLWSLNCIKWMWGQRDMNNAPYPWEVAVFSMYSMLGEDNTAKELSTHDANKVMNFIRSNMFYGFDKYDMRCWAPNALIKPEYKNQYLLKVLFERYCYFFSFKNKFVNIVDELRRKLSIDWRAALDLFIIVIGIGLAGIPFEVVGQKVLNSENIYFTPEILDLLNRLSLPLEEFRNKQVRCIRERKSTSFLIKNILEESPFIRNDDKYYLPAPHLVLLALTSGIMAQLTRGDDNLCAHIGKQIQEPYVLSLFRKANCYDNVRGEEKYGSHGASDSPDVIVQKSDKCLLVESKFSRPSYKVLDLLAETSKEAAKKYAEYVIQLYRRMRERRRYVDGKVYSDNDVFGLVVVFEDSLIFRNFIWELVNDKFPNEIDYIKTHIRIVGLYEVERFCYHHIDIIQILTKMAPNKDNQNDFVLSYDGEWPSAEFPVFDRWINDTKGLAQRMICSIRECE